MLLLMFQCDYRCGSITYLGELVDISVMFHYYILNIVTFTAYSGYIMTQKLFVFSSGFTNKHDQQ